MLLVCWIGFIQLCYKIADIAPSSGPCCLDIQIEHNSAEPRSHSYHSLLNFRKRFVEELFADSSGVFCDLLEVGSGHPVGNIFDYQGRS